MSYYLDALLNPPTNDMILEHLKKEMGHIPADYIEFLKQCNGLTLYHKNYGSFTLKAVTLSRPESL